MEHSRANYVVLLHAGEVANSLRELSAEYGGQAEVPQPLGRGVVAAARPAVLLGAAGTQLSTGPRAASLAEYRNRHYVYQFSQPGYRAYRAVEDVLGARMDDVTLSRLVLPELLADLQDLATANRDGDAELVYRKLSRLDSALADMAERAARFYLMLSELSHSTESSAEVFLAHKDALLAHLREFSSELERYTPRLAAAVADVAATGCRASAGTGRRGRRADLPHPGRSVGRLAPTLGRTGALVHRRRARRSRHRPAARRTGCRTARSVRWRRCWRCFAGSPRRAAAGSAGRASCGTSPPGSAGRPTWTPRMRCSGWCSTSANPGTSAGCIPIPELIPTRRELVGGPAGGDLPDTGRDRAGRQPRLARPGWSATRRVGGGCTTRRRPSSGPGGRSGQPCRRPACPTAAC